MDNINSSGEIQRFNASKDIAQQRDVPLIIDHIRAMKYCTNGYSDTEDEPDENKKNINKAAGLRKVIHSQRNIIFLMCKSLVLQRSTNEWMKKYKTEEEMQKNPFEKFECDHKDLVNIIDFLDFCEKQIDLAKKTRNLADDFVVEIHTSEGSVWNVTDNYYNMLRDLQEVYAQLELIMYKNGVISSGIMENEDITYKEQEALFLERFRES